MPTHSYILEAHNITKEFHQPKKHYVLKDNSLFIEKESLTAIYGESGSGKSTLLYILATLDTHFDGKLIIDNTIIKEQSSSFLSDFRNKNIGFVYQSHYLLQEFDVLNNVVNYPVKTRKN